MLDTENFILHYLHLQVILCYYHTDHFITVQDHLSLYDF